MQGHVDELQLVDALKLAVVAADREGQLQVANDGATILHGGTTHDLVGRPLSDFRRRHAYAGGRRRRPHPGAQRRDVAR